MLSKSEKNWIKSLKNKKTRDLNKEFIAEGSRIVLDILKDNSSKLKLLCATQNWLDKVPSNQIKTLDHIRIVPDTILTSIASLKSTEEVLAIFSYPDSYLNGDNSFIVYLDQIRDPGNMGTIIRSADWFGISKIYCSPDSVDIYNNKCVQATMSSIMRVQILEKSWSEMMELFPNLEKYAATMEGTSLYELNKAEVRFVCIGNEARGLSSFIIDDCKKQFSIPARMSLGAESLNAAVATSLIMAWKMNP